MNALNFAIFSIYIIIFMLCTEEREKKKERIEVCFILIDNESIRRRRLWL